MANNVVTIAGTMASGKTTTLLKLAIMEALQRPVIYIAQEETATGIQQRIVTLAEECSLHLESFVHRFHIVDARGSREYLKGLAVGCSTYSLFMDAGPYIRDYTSDELFVDVVKHAKNAYQCVNARRPSKPFPHFADGCDVVMG